MSRPARSLDNDLVDLAEFRRRRAARSAAQTEQRRAETSAITFAWVPVIVWVPVWSAG
jgi:hypothetical protein